MKKRFLSALLVLCLLCALLPAAALPAAAYSDTDVAYPVEGGSIYFDKATGTITDCDASVTKADIPSKIDGVPVTSIGRDAFFQCSSLTSVTIPNSVTSIGDSAFYSCRSLTSVTIPDSVTSIGRDAFFQCSSLTSVTIPNGVTSIGDTAFAWCTSLTRVTIPNSVTSIGSWAFAWCKGLKSVKIGDGVTSIDRQAFVWCSSLMGIWVSEKNACYSSDESGVLFNKDKTELIQAPGAITGEYTISAGVMNICDAAFGDCRKLTAIHVAEGNPVYSSTDGVLFNLNKSTLITYPGGKTDKEYRIPSSVTSIADNAFSGCTRLTSVMIPNSVVSIGYAVFECCSSLTSVTIPENVTSIGHFAFCDCSSLTSVTIPNSVTSIGGSAFCYCTSLTSVTIGSSVTSIGDWAFEGCSSLISVCFGGNAPEIGVCVFQILNEETWEYVNIPNLTLYYIEGKDGWTSPTWNGYPTATWDGVNVPVAYADVSKTAWYYDEVQYATKNGLMNGVGGGKFDPEGSMTRAMLVTVLWRYEGAPMGCQNPFLDVPGGQWYTDAVAWAAANEIVGGVGNNKFDPDGNVTREQMAAILFRYANKKGIDTGKRGELGSFPDAGKISLYATDAIAWTVAEGIINGSDGRLLPQGDATRAQVSAILMRFIENIVKK